MSTQSTIIQDSDFLLYKEAFDDSRIYLQLYDCKDLTVRTNHYQEATEQQVSVGIPIHVWQKIVNEWVNSSQHEEVIHLDLNDSFEKLLEHNLKKKNTNRSS